MVTHLQVLHDCFADLLQQINICGVIDILIEVRRIIWFTGCLVNSGWIAQKRLTIIFCDTTKLLEFCNLETLE